MAEKPILESPLEPETGWSTINAPELYSFEKPGDTIAGVLVAIAMIELNVEGKARRVTQFTLRRDDKLLKFLGTYDLLQKLSQDQVGSPVRIKFRGEDPTVSRNGNAMKVFDVQFKPSPRPERPTITDEDIPF